MTVENPKSSPIEHQAAISIVQGLAEWYASFTPEIRNETHTALVEFGLMQTNEEGKYGLTPFGVDAMAVMVMHGMLGQTRGIIDATLKALEEQFEEGGDLDG